MTLKVEYLDDFKVVFKSALGYDQGDLIHEKRPEIGNLVRLSL
jgi:hypothetical protein